MSLSDNLNRSPMTVVDSLLRGIPVLGSEASKARAELVELVSAAQAGRDALRIAGASLHADRLSATLGRFLGAVQS